MPPAAAALPRQIKHSVTLYVTVTSDPSISCTPCSTGVKHYCLQCLQAVATFSLQSAALLISQACDLSVSSTYTPQPACTRHSRSSAGPRLLGLAFLRAPLRGNQTRDPEQAEAGAGALRAQFLLPQATELPPGPSRRARGHAYNSQNNHPQEQQKLHSNSYWAATARHRQRPASRPLSLALQLHPLSLHLLCGLPVNHLRGAIATLVAILTRHLYARRYFLCGRSRRSPVASIAYQRWLRSRQWELALWLGGAGSQDGVGGGSRVAVPVGLRPCRPSLGGLRQSCRGRAAWAPRCRSVGARDEASRAVAAQGLPPDWVRHGVALGTGKLGAGCSLPAACLAVQGGCESSS